MKSEQYQAYQRHCQEYELPPDAPLIEHPKTRNFFAGLIKSRIVEQAQSLGAYVDPDLLQIRLANSPIRHSLTTYYKETRFSKLSELMFGVNLSWPVHLGLGFGVALGYGMLRPIKTMVTD